MSLAELRQLTFHVLDDGFIRIVDAMGDDAAICNAARISYGQGTRSVSDDRTLIRYLMRHHHHTPFEMACIKLHVRVPMDVMRQWIRHRTAHVNEISTRYSVAIDAMQRTAPDAWRGQAQGNRQGSSGTVVGWPDPASHKLATGDEYDPDVMRNFPTPGEYLSSEERLFHERARRVYRERLAFGVAREQARKDLPLCNYTEAFWACDLRNVLHFLGLRMDAHAQEEIRSYAKVIGEEIVAGLFPLTWEAFRDYVLDAMSLSAQEIEAARRFAGQAATARQGTFVNAREWEECRAKLARLGLIPLDQPTAELPI